ncbi:hypothetical protein [Allosediminivita pacifica]|uniref:Uncharacterized protein n=1 Tax=Allosediminivita pacifica TaxID=1267769 RepID=A0A2T6ASC8_9RHOB|nr:hypothetical protein [Allosediminivita pacifica]PTX46721.1 hypothetical protein C8N44_11589 [Allosediminivita pacifica]GGB16309.1 hypothetical protein GCM10011324_28210 [Allosediminivita pacifica]
MRFALLALVLSCPGALSAQGLFSAPSEAQQQFSVQSPVAAPSGKIIEDALRDFDAQLAAPVRSAEGVTLVPYQDLVDQKTEAQWSFEGEQSKALGVDISNICLTAAGACWVGYTTAGSSCFCETKDMLELGIVR